MRLIGNIIWFIFGGLISGLLWLLLGALLCVTIIGIPLGIQCFKVATLSFAPFGKKVDLNPGKHMISNVIWAVLLGWELALYYLFAGIACCITIIGIPNGIVAFKLMKLAFLPFGAEIKG
jgi:uncharacterized membrane protein YccF (DUF307 family)